MDASFEHARKHRVIMQYKRARVRFARDFPVVVPALARHARWRPAVPRERLIRRVHFPRVLRYPVLVRVKAELGLGVRVFIRGAFFGRDRESACVNLLKPEVGPLETREKGKGRS